MTVNLRAHFDGRVIVPDEPVDLPDNQPLAVQVSMPAKNAPRKAGWAKDILPELPESFFDPLPNDLLDLFEGKSI
jgi:hypothetical protein